MQGGYNIEPLVSISDDAELAPIVAEVPYLILCLCLMLSMM